MEMKLPKLENERSISANITKRLNRLSTYKFYQVLARDSGSFAMLAVNMVMLLLCIPAMYIILNEEALVGSLATSLPIYNVFGINSGSWIGSLEYLNNSADALHVTAVAWCCLASLTSVFLFSGVFCAIRDAFWTGKMTFMKSFFRGVRTNFFYALFTALVFASLALGLINLYVYMQYLLPLWACIIVIVLAAIVALLIAMYFLILCSVTAAYKQSLAQNLSDSWVLMWGNFTSNLFKLFMTILPALLYWGLSTWYSSMAFVWSIAMIFIGLYAMPLIWQTHMMRSFAYIHPVAQVKKGDMKKQNVA